MLIAFRRTLQPPTEIQMVVDVDGNWDRLKVEMCKAWDIEQEFDEAEVWTSLRHGDTVLIDLTLYCVWNRDRHDASGAAPCALFAMDHGHLVTVDDKMVPWGSAQ